MTELQLSHAELRAAVILAGKEIRKLNFGKADSPVLAILRRVLRESRVCRAQRWNYHEGPTTLADLRRIRLSNCIFAFSSLNGYTVFS